MTSTWTHCPFFVDLWVYMCVFANTPHFVSAWTHMAPAASFILSCACRFLWHIRQPASTYPTSSGYLWPHLTWWKFSAYCLWNYGLDNKMLVATIIWILEVRSRTNWTQDFCITLVFDLGKNGTVKCFIKNKSFCTSNLCAWLNVAGSFKHWNRK